MYLTFDALGINTDLTHVINLSHMIEHDDRVVDENSLYAAIVLYVATWSLEQGVALDDAFPLYIVDSDTTGENAPQLDAGPDTDLTTWAKEVAQFAWFVEREARSVSDRDQIFAYVNGAGWKYVDFDDLENEVSEKYSSELEHGNYTEFAKEYLDNLCDDIPSYLEPYFDYDKYGQDLVHDFNQYEWNNRTFLYHQ